MPDLEFLPGWYNVRLARRRFVKLQACGLALLMLGLSGWTIGAQRNFHNRQSMLKSLEHDLEQKHTEKKILDEQLSLRQELQQREELISSLGFPVEMTRLLQTLDSVMPKEMSLTLFDCTTEETVRQVTSVAGIKPGAEKEKQFDRRLKVKLQGVTPNDMDLGTLCYGLTGKPFFDQVSVTYMREKIDSGHIFREFEITFSMQLSQPAGN
jgi:hypothetical protein